MAVWCFCGDDNESVECELLLLKKNYEEIVPMELPYTLASIEKAVANEALFPVKKLIIFRDVLAGKVVFRGKPSAAFAPVLAVLQQKTGEVDLVFIDKDPKKNKTYETLFPKAVVKSFKLPNYLYDFLDAMYPGNSTRAIQLLGQASDASATELAFYLLKRRVRDLISILQKQPIPGMLEWQAGKLRGQAVKWKLDSLYSFYMALWNIEKGIKTSTMPYDLKGALEIAISYYLE